MIERLARRILHEAAPCRPDVCDSSVCIPPTPELPSRQYSAAKIDYSPRASDSKMTVPLTGALIRVKQKVNPVYRGNKEMCRKWVANGSPSTPAPSPPVSLRDSSDGGEGAGLLVRLATQLRNWSVLKIQKLKQQQKRGIRPSGTLSGFRVFTVCFGQTLENECAPGRIQIAGDIRRLS